MKSSPSPLPCEMPGACRQVSTLFLLAKPLYWLREQIQSPISAVSHTTTLDPLSQEGSPVGPFPKARPVALLFYSHFFPPSIGGVQTTALLLPKGLAELRDPQGAAQFKVTLATQIPAGNYDDSALPFRVVRRPGLFQLWRLIRACDVVHVAGPALAPLSLGLLSRKPVVVEHHGFQTICPNGQLLIEPGATPCPGHFIAHRYLKCLRCNAAQGWFTSWKLWLLTFARRLLCARAAVNITETQWLRDLLHPPRVTVIPHGFDPGQAISRPARPSDTPVIVFMGRLVTTKGVPILFQAAKILQDQNCRFELLLIGDGPERAALEQFAQWSQLTAKVRFVGHLPGAEVETALAKAAVVVVPSLGGEVFGFVVAENMLRALPVVASDIGAFREVLGDTGLMFRTGDALDLSRALLRVLDDPLLAAALGQRARRRALDFFSQSRMIEAHARVYRDVCAATQC
jgi:glycogen synthase